jgi:HEAT repeat protein
VEGKTDRSATVEVRSVSGNANAFWSESAVASASVLINGQAAGNLNNRQTLSVTVAAGVLRVAAKSGFLRSRTLVLSLAAGDIARLECGFRSGLHVLLGMLVMSVFGIVSFAITVSGSALPSVVPVTGMVVLTALLIDLLRGAFMPGARLYLRPRAVFDVVDITPMQAAPPSIPLGTEPQGGSYQISLKGVLVFVAFCAPILFLARERWNFHSKSELARAVWMLRSKDPGYRSTGLKDLRIFMIMHSNAMKEVDAVIPELLAGLREERPAIRKAVADSLFEIVSEFERRSSPVPRAQAVAAGLAEALRDTDSDVRRLSALGLYFTYSSPGAPPSPLPDALDRFLDLLSEAFQGPDEKVRICTFQVLSKVAPRVGRAAPSGLVAALGSKVAVIRGEAVNTLVKFPVGVDLLLPKLFEVLERDEDPKVRQSCFSAMAGIRPLPASIPVLIKALRSPEQKARFRAADLLSQIGPRASEAVPAVLPLLEERFDPSTFLERNHPERADPAVAATWALRSIAPGTRMHEPARTSLQKLLGVSGHLWRRSEVESALRDFDPIEGLGPDSQDQ